MTLKIKTIGPITTIHDGAELPLPASRKSRALLAYLLLNEGPHSREALCELLWDVPDDPRGALRWSLSKLRPILNCDGVERIGSDRQQVWCEKSDIRIDQDDWRDPSGWTGKSEDEVEALWDEGATALLMDCDVPNQSSYAAWIAGQRAAFEKSRAAIAEAQALRQDMPATARDAWAQRWLQLAPFIDDAAKNAVAARHAIAGIGAAKELAEKLERSYSEAELPVPDFFAEDANEIASDALAQPIADPTPTEPPLPDQDIRFVQTHDNISIAWASVGDPASPPLVKAANWLNHLELDWEAPIWSPLFRDLASAFHLIRYDERGCGLSDWDCHELTFESFVTDLEQVVEAAGLDRFPLLGISQGAAVSIEYAARHPDKVSHLVLFGAYDCGWRHVASEEETREREAVMVLTETGWGSDNPAYRHLFSRTFMPDAEPSELDWFDEFQRQTTSSANAVRFLEAFSTIDVSDRLAEVQCPTLVVHSRDDQRIPLATGRKLATRIPGARFAGIESRNHLLLGREAASSEFLRLVRDFLKEG
ncbi:alpha/beta fold hydrolase [Erythrobacter sp. YT30]|uniref:alpha/beta fold hydrolase n=1 Tax=Erythrobacter sp. YT30 TaxID=1735012 RepID=UPI00076C849B|nr:alpha/beta fold hydrolase [Erythrobacter sp. YT30]KWV90436.1 hypothetical protein AUC45_14390 [Erythrobacter sp. YT30]